MHIDELKKANEISTKLVSLKKAKKILEDKQKSKTPIPINMSNAWTNALYELTIGTSGMDRIYTIMIQTIDGRINQLNEKFKAL